MLRMDTFPVKKPKVAAGAYRRILGSMPLLCVDAVIRNSAGKVLLVKRKNEPLKNHWWVPGGRVLKGESIERAFRRKMREELGVRLGKVRCIGYYEAVDMRHAGLREHGGRLHSFSMVFEALLDATNIVLDSQSTDWGYFEKLPTRFAVQHF